MSGKIEDVKAWSVDQVVAWLVENGLEDLDEKFVAHKVDGTRLLSLTDDDMLNVLKIRSAVMREALKAKIEGLSLAVIPSSVLVCPLHNKPLETFCEQDQELVCVQCLVTTHNSHRVCSPEAAIEGKKKALKETKTKLVSHATTTDTLLGEVVKDIAVLNTSLEASIEAIETQFSELHELLDVKKDEMLSEVKRLHSECLKPLEDLTSRHNEVMRECKDLLAQMEKILSDETKEIKVLDGESKKSSDKAKRILESKVVSSSKKAEIVVMFDESKIKSIKEAITSIGSVAEKGK
jgi:hypothetical protein